MGMQLELSRLTPFAEFVYCPGLSNLNKQGLSVKNVGWEIKTGLKFKAKELGNTSVTVNEH
jgi:hypothetical protein